MSADPSDRPSAGGPSLQTLSTGFVVAVVGFFSSFPILLQGIEAMGASQAEAASGLMAAALSMGLAGIALSLSTRAPASVAWSTPGAALLAVTVPLETGFAGAVAGFLIAGALTVVAGLWRPLGRLATSIPAALAQAMLAGVLVSLCTAPFVALAEEPQTALPIILAWFLAGRLNRLAAVPAAVLAAFAVTTAPHGFLPPMPEALVSTPVAVMPALSWEALVNIGLPLFIVTMATQNIPGIAILRSFGYTTPPGPMLAGVGAFSLASAPFGAPATCLAAITAAMCANPESHPDPARRYWSAAIAGAFYTLFGLFAAGIVALAALAPPMTLETLAGVALLGVFANSAAAALEAPDHREAAAITFLVTASGMSAAGLGAPVWGLILGGTALGVSRLRASRSRT